MPKDAPRMHTSRTFLKIVPEISLRNRIAFYYTVATAFLIGLVFMLVYYVVDSTVYRHFDQELMAEVTEILEENDLKSNDFTGLASFRSIDEDDRQEEKDEHDVFRHNDVEPQFIQLVDAKGLVVKKSVNLFPDSLSFHARFRRTAYFNSNVNGQTVRQVQVPLENRHGLTEGYLLVAFPLENVIIVLSDLQMVFLFSFPGIILILFVLTRLIAGRSIRPIDEVIATAEKMTQANLDQRIPLPRNRDELYRLSATINALLDRLQDAFLREKQFTADASHELKTPLAAVKGTLDVLVRKPREREHYETKIHYCLQELNRMARLIDQLLMLARYESTGLRPRIEEIELSILIEAAIERLKPHAAEKEMTVRFNRMQSGNVAADPAMLEMIIENILSNAIKYSPSGSPIDIALEPGTNAFLCSISDHGIGIPEEKLHAIFERFYRVDESRSSSTGGFGLGLSIVKKLADLQQIRIAVQSARNEGTIFTLSIPVSFSCPYPKSIVKGVQTGCRVNGRQKIGLAGAAERHGNSENSA
jgi:heavy metal sensor kinase